MSTSAPRTIFPKEIHINLEGGIPEEVDCSTISVELSWKQTACPSVGNRWINYGGRTPWNPLQWLGVMDQEHTAAWVDARNRMQSDEKVKELEDIPMYIIICVQTKQLLAFYKNSFQQRNICETYVCLSRKGNESEKCR